MHTATQTPLANLWDLVSLIPNEAEEEMKASELFQLGGYWDSLVGVQILRRHDRDLARQLLMWFIEDRQTAMVELFGKIIALKHRADDDVELVRARAFYGRMDRDLQLVGERHPDLMITPASNQAVG